MTHLPSVSVIILNWNGKDLLKKFLPSVISSGYSNLTIVVADNGSTDDSVLFLKNYFPQVKILENPENEGFSKGYNTALKKIETDYYILLNSDVEVSTGWITPIISLMEKDKRIVACQPKILSFNKKNEFDYAGASGGWIDIFGYPFARGRVFDTCEKDKAQYDQASEIFWASGAALFIKSAAFHEVGGFDEYFFAHQEEIDLCWRLKRAGYKIYAEPSSIVYHVGGGTLPMGSPRKVYLNFRNNLVMLYKNLPTSEAIWKIPLRMILDVVAAFQALIQGNASSFNSILYAQYNFFKWIFIGRRVNKLPKIKSKNAAGLYNGSIVWYYFVKKMKTFSEITGHKK